MSLVNTETGAIVQRDPEEVAAIAMLTQAISALTGALDEMPISEITAMKARVSTVQTATKELGMSKEAQELAAEAVRRAEWALGRAIRKGQEEGTVAKLGDGRGERSVLGTDLASPTDFATDVELYDRPSQRKYGILSMAEASPEEFESAVTEARAEGNLSRANVVRKVKGQQPPRPLTERIKEIRDLAEKGASRDQIAKHFGVSEKHIFEITKANGIKTASELLGRRRRIDHNRVLDNVTEALEVAAISLRDIDPEALDRDEAVERLDSLDLSIKALAKAIKKIRESFHE